MRHMIFTTKKYKEEQNKSLNKKEEQRPLRKLDFEKSDKKIDNDAMEKMDRVERTIEKPRKSYEVKILTSRNKQSESSFVRPS